MQTRDVLKKVNIDYEKNIYLPQHGLICLQLTRLKNLFLKAKDTSSFLLFYFTQSPPFRRKNILLVR